MEARIDLGGMPCRSRQWPSRICIPPVRLRLSGSAV